LEFARKMFNESIWPIVGGSCSSSLSDTLSVVSDDKAPMWPAPGSEDTELGVLMEPEVGHGETEVYAGVQA
jgi:hypothetical protein